MNVLDGPDGGFIDGEEFDAAVTKAMEKAQSTYGAKDLEEYNDQIRENLIPLPRVED